MGLKTFAVARMNGRIAIAVEDYRGQDLLPSFGVFGTCDDWSALAHRRERGGHVIGGPRGEPGVYADRRIEVWIGVAKDRCHRPSRRHPGNVNSTFFDLVLVHHLFRDAGDDGRLAPAALLVCGLEPVPASLHVGVPRLRRVGDEERVLLGEPVRAGAPGEVVRVLGATVKHHDKWNRLAGVSARHVELVRAGPRTARVRPLDETSFLRRGYARTLDAAVERVRRQDTPSGRAWPMTGRVPACLLAA